MSHIHVQKCGKSANIIIFVLIFFMAYRIATGLLFTYELNLLAVNIQNSTFFKLSCAI